MLRLSRFRLLCMLLFWMIAVVAVRINHNITQLPSPHFILSRFYFLTSFSMSHYWSKQLRIHKHKNLISIVRIHNHIHTKTHSTQSSNFFFSLKSHSSMLHTYTTTPKLREWVEEKRSGNWRSNEAVNIEVMTGIWKPCSFFLQLQRSIAAKTSCRGHNGVT